MLHTWYSELPKHFGHDHGGCQLVNFIILVIYLFSGGRNITKNAGNGGWTPRIVCLTNSFVSFLSQFLFMLEQTAGNAVFLDETKEDAIWGTLLKVTRRARTHTHASENTWLWQKKNLYFNQPWTECARAKNRHTQAEDLHSICMQMDRLRASAGCRVNGK